MIGSGLKKLAAENGMQVAHGVAYGSLKGYAATLSEGSGYKQIVITTKFTDPEKLQLLQGALNQKNLTREYRVQNLAFTPQGIQIVFTDNPGTMKKLQAFIDWFFPLLTEHAALPSNVCMECGSQVSGGCWKLIDGVAYYMHETCAEKLRQNIAVEDEERKREAGGSYGTGLIGALLGGAIGAVLWAIVLNMGYVASVVGLAIGWLADKGYSLLKGKQGKAKVAILIIAIIFGVLLGNFLADTFTLVSMINAGEADITYGEIPLLILALLLSDGEYLAGTLGNILTGLLFAGLGVFALLKKAGKEVADTKFVDLP